MSDVTTRAMNLTLEIEAYEEELRRELARPMRHRTTTAADTQITTGGLNDVGGISMGRIIDTRGAIDLLAQAIGRLESLDGLAASDPGLGRDSDARNAVIGKDLLFNAHLCRKAETLVADQYYAFKGRDENLR